MHYDTNGNPKENHSMKSIKESIYSYLDLGIDNDDYPSNKKAIGATPESKEDDTDNRFDLVKTIMANWNQIWGDTLSEKVAFANVQGNEIVIIASDTNIASYVKTTYYDIIDKINRIIKTNGQPRLETDGNGSGNDRTDDVLSNTGDDRTSNRTGNRLVVEHIRVVVVGKSIGCA